MCGLLSPYLPVPSLVMFMHVADVFILHLGYTSYEVVAVFHKSKKTKCFPYLCVLIFNLICITFLEPRILRRFLAFGEIYGPFSYRV